METKEQVNKLYMIQEMMQYPRMQHNVGRTLAPLTVGHALKNCEVFRNVARSYNIILFYSVSFAYIPALSSQWKWYLKW